MPARPRRALPALVVVAVAVFAGCAPAGLDADQARVEARECASLLERHVSRRVPTGRIVLDGTTVDLGADPEGFYRELEKARGPDDFPLTGGRAESAQRASFISDLCKAKDASTSTTSTAATTTTAPPGATGAGG